MAKQRFLDDSTRPVESRPIPSRLVSMGRHAAMGAAGSLAVYVAYYPSDSVAVEAGDGLWFAVLAIAWATLVAAVCWRRDDSKEGGFSKTGFDWIDLSSISLATWMMVAAFLNSDQSDLRMGTNEAWWWVTASAILIAARRTLTSLAIRKSFLLLTICITIGLSADALHQDWISLPQTRSNYLANPDEVVRQMGIDAPPNSSTRMVLENRIMDGGPSATFALANSLAALLLLGVVIVVAAMRLTWKRICIRSKLGLIGCLLVLAPALLAVRSRAALVATLLGVTLVWLLRSPADWAKPVQAERSGHKDEASPHLESTLSRQSRAQNRLTAVIALMSACIVGLISLAMFGNPEWYGQAPASLAFRLQYWAATWRMMLDNAVLGAGPGNFQSLYDRYRDVSTTEQVADPHNFLLETLASGGPIALALLLVIMVLGFQYLNKHRPAPEPEWLEENPRWVDGRSVLIGGGVMLAVIWFLGLLTLHTPDFSSHRFAIPIALGLGWTTYAAFQKLNEPQVDQIQLVGFVSILVHLSVSGGWTVPGVAFWIWMLLGGLTRIRVKTETVSTSAQSNSARRPRLAITLGFFALTAITFMSVRPVSQQSWLLSVADASLRSGSTGKSARVLAEAVAADQWSSKSPLLQSDFLYREVIRRNNSSSARRAYEQCVKVVANRTGPNPSVSRQLATHRLHLYQVFGKPDDLNTAKQSLQTAWQGSPANQWLAAQLAEIAIVQDDESANQWIQRAQTLAELGNNLERSLRLQLIYVAEPIGDRAAMTPIRTPANERLQASDKK